MRRMLTEKDVDKIDSIDPADIETLKATGSPKNAKSGYVLTADGKGKATYQYKSGGTNIQSDYMFSISQTGYKTDGDGNKFLAKEFYYSNKDIISVWMRNSLKANGVTIPRAEYTLTKTTAYQGGPDSVVIYFPDETISKYSITAQTEFTGNVSLLYKN